MPRLLDSITAVSGILGRPVKPGDDARERGALVFHDKPPRPRGAMRPSFCKNCSPSKIEGAGNAGRLMRPRPRVRMVSEAHEHSHHGHTGFTRHSPRNGFNGLFRALPGDEFVLSPSSAD